MLYEVITDPQSFNTEDHEGSLELPSYGIVDAGASYRWYLKNNNVLKFRLNINNVLNKQYISQSDTNIHAGEGDDTWKGIDTDNIVYFGNGTTWNFSRITSYNVCYTKLLRNRGCCNFAPAALRFGLPCYARCVITSYSIHYTKLYEGYLHRRH